MYWLIREADGQKYQFVKENTYFHLQNIVRGVFEVLFNKHILLTCGRSVDTDMTVPT